MLPEIKLTWPVEARAEAETNARQSVERFLAFWKSLPTGEGDLPSLRGILDRADPALQPHVALVDIVPPRSMPIRLFATAREHRFGQNLTGVDALELYPAALRERVWASGVAVVSRPCGLLTERTMTSARGASLQILSLSLPLAVPSGAPKCLTNFSATIGLVPDRHEIAEVYAIGPAHWLDLGHGVPAEA
jgi:hypothetical protein